MARARQQPAGARRRPPRRRDLSRTWRARRALERIERDARATPRRACPARGSRASASQWRLGPAEFFAGIPGTVGGALAMNAGAWGGETWQHVVDVDVARPPRRRRTRAAGEYRSATARCARPRRRVVRRRAPRVRAQPGRERRARSANCWSGARQTQPIGAWSCGSTFTNPPGDHAARLIDAAGLKGFRIGGAVGVGEARELHHQRGQRPRAADIEAADRARAGRGRALHGVRLVPEVRIVGEPRMSAAAHDPGTARARPRRRTSAASPCCSAATPPSARCRCQSGRNVLAALQAPRRRCRMRSTASRRRCRARQRGLRPRLEHHARPRRRERRGAGCARVRSACPTPAAACSASALTLDKLRTKRSGSPPACRRRRYVRARGRGRLSRAVARIGLPLIVKPSLAGLERRHQQVQARRPAARRPTRTRARSIR